MAQASIFRKLGKNDIYMASVTINEDLQNKLRKRPKGKKKSNQTALPDTKITDKKKILWSITGTGYLISDTDANYPTAQNKYDALMASSPLGMLFTSGDMTFIHRSREYTGAIEKINFREDASKRADKSGGGIDKFEVTFTFAVGTVK
jgi:hypothetical protein